MKTGYLSLLLIGLLLIPTISEAISFIKIADAETPIYNSSEHFQHFGEPYLYEGKLVFRAKNKKDEQGIYSNLYGSIRLIADVHTAIPNGKGNFTNFGLPEHAITGAYHYSAFNSPSLDGKSIAFLGIGKNHQIGIYVFDKDGLHVVADTHTLIPNTKEHFIRFNGPYINQQKILFQADGKLHRQGLFLYSHQQLKLLYNLDTPIPASSETFQKIWNPSFDNGHVAFKGISVTNKEGIYTDVSGSLKAVATASTKIPETAEHFVSVGGPSLKGKYMAFRGAGDTYDGIYVNDQGSLHAIVDNHTIIPGTNDTFEIAANPTYDHGNTVFEGKGKKHQGIYILWNDTLQKVIAENDELEHKKVTQLSLGAVSLSYNLVAFSVQFADGSEALYIAQL